MTRWTDVLADQSGVIARRQALAGGLAPHDLRRMVRRRELVRMHDGVYLHHTGEPAWLERAWAGVLFAWPAALWGPSALRAVGGAGRRERDDALIHVAVDRRAGRRTEPEGVRIHHVSRLAERVQWNASPPRMRLEEAALDVAAAAATDLTAIAVLADACQSRRTTAARLLSALEDRPRIFRRPLLDGALRDVAEGTCSVLEHGYLHLVERPHAFPRARRQARVTASTGVVYRDADYGAVVLELDGRLFHDTASARDADFERDLDAATSGAATLRLSYGQVFDRPCSTAAKVARVLNAHGVVFEPTRCGPGCVVVRTAVA